MYRERERGGGWAREEGSTYSKSKYGYTYSIE